MCELCGHKQPIASLLQLHLVVCSHKDSTSRAHHSTGTDALAQLCKVCTAVAHCVHCVLRGAGIISAELLSWLPRGAGVINGARGGHLVEEDLLQALNGGQVGSRGSSSSSSRADTEALMTCSSGQRWLHTAGCG
jgi:phosphoglycerate dehydrogenase-like enzyme